ncbi:ComEA family DNA-binding protein [Candidatus Sumerlaeota bacterium]
MFSGLTIQEQRVLIVLVVLIGTGLGVQHYRSLGQSSRLEILQLDNPDQNSDNPNDQPPTEPPTAPKPGQGLVNINTADTGELSGLYRIGEPTARRIIDYRDTHGPFANIDQLASVPGIGPRTLAGNRERITVGAGPATPGASLPATGNDDPTTASRQALPPNVAPPAAHPSAKIDINAASQEQLEQLPGIGPVLARGIIEHRTKYGPFAHPRQLLNVPGIGPRKLQAIATRITAANKAAAPGTH